MQKEIIQKTRESLAGKGLNFSYQTVRAICSTYESAKAAFSGRKSRRKLTSADARRMNEAKKKKAAEAK